MSDVQTVQRTKQGGGRAFHSRLEPFVEFIREQRHRRKTWQEIAELLRTEKTCPISFQGVHQFYRRFVERQARPHWEDNQPINPVATLAAESRKPIVASLPATRSFRAPNPDSINLNDPTKVL
jgi:hypothetical protein